MMKNGVDINEVKVESVMSKDFEVITRDTTIREVRDLFLKNHFKTLVIVDDNGQITGVIAAFDFLNLFTPDAKFVYEDVKNRPVSSVESVARPGAITVGPKDPLRKSIEYMSSFRLRCLPVMDRSRKVVGLISVSDIVRFMMPE